MDSNVKKGIAFSKNPILLRSSLTVDDYNPITGIPFTVYASGMNQRYVGRYNQPFSVNISEIVDAYAYTIGEPIMTYHINGVREVEDPGTISERKIYVDITEDNLDEWECLIIAGGVSRQNYRRYARMKTDAFEARFLNNANNFFMTTRTAGWRIVMKETELYPLYFISLEKFLYMTVVERTTGKTLIQDGNFDSGIFALDIDALRKQFFDEYGVLSNSFDIYKGDPSQYSCSIVIERSDPARERYRLKFRNSLGVFEIIELAGELAITPDYAAADEARFSRYDAETDDFTADRERITRPQSLTIETGVMRADTVRFLMDMIGSEEVYLLDLSELPVKVIPSIEELKYKPRPETPQKFTVKLQMAEDETNIMQDIIDGTEGRKPRVFSKQFSKQFN
ncbi:hypothetical protein [Duncaniella muris]|uniref:hypothetical protein n=1 Tax=Duncaniella muris TaxID=2094150 RepID=UPI0025B48EBE|nr:hypothetical protein [Duncaniella muris]